MTDVLLINPKGLQPLFNAMPPLGLGTMGCVLEKEGFSVAILDLEIEADSFDLSQLIRSTAPKIVGISGTTSTRFGSFQIARAAKQVSREIITVYGGCHATFTADDTLRHIPEIDYVVIGEGEWTLLELAHFLLRQEGRLETIRGISYRKGEEIATNEPRERITDLDSLPYSRHLFKMESYPSLLEFLEVPAAVIMSARGCPFDCYFCSASRMCGKIYTTRSASHVADEIEYCIKNFNAQGIKFFDSTLTLNKKHALAITKELIRRNIRVPWECEIRVDTVDRDLLGEMKKAGCYYVNLGVESSNEDILQTIGKKITLAQVENTLRWCHELGIMTKVFFTFGHLHETIEEARETFEFIDQHKAAITNPAIGPNMKIYPGTRLANYATENALLPRTFSWSKPTAGFVPEVYFEDNVPILVQPSFGLKEMAEVRRLVEWISFRRQAANYRRNLRLGTVVSKLKEKIKSGEIFRWSVQVIRELFQIGFRYKKPFKTKKK